MPIGLALAFLTPMRGPRLWMGLVALLLLARWRGKERLGFF